jgi:hypothetical protein
MQCHCIPVWRIFVMGDAKKGAVQLRLVPDSENAANSEGQLAGHNSGQQTALKNSLVLQLTALADSLDREVAALIGL